MPSLACPLCHKPLRPEDLAEGRCDACGGRLSPGLSEQLMAGPGDLVRRLPAAVSMPEMARRAAPGKHLEGRPSAVRAALSSPALVLLLLGGAFACFFLPWASTERAAYSTGVNGVGRWGGLFSKWHPGVTARQSGLQMAVGTASFRAEDGSKVEEKAPGEVYHQQYLAPALFGYPVCLLVAAAACLHRNPLGRSAVVALWAGLALLFLLLQFLVGFPYPVSGTPTAGRYTPWLWGSLAATFATLLLLGWRTRPREMASSAPRLAAGLLFVAVTAAYATSFFLPAAKVQLSFWVHSRGTIMLTTPGNPLYRQTDFTGKEAFSEALAFGLQCWHANLFVWMGLLLLGVRRWLWTAGAGAVALLLALTFPLHAALVGRTDVYRAGYWLWVGSMGLLAAGGLIGWLRWRE